MSLASVNPATGETFATFDELDDAALELCLARAAETFTAYRRTSFAERAAWLTRAGEILDERTDQIARMMTREMGKTLVSARAEVSKCATACRFYAEHAEGFLRAEPADARAVGAARAYSTYRPLGPVLAVMPWNFPLWQAMRFAAPALMAGNVGLLKHASNVPQTALLLQELFADAGFPRGAFQTLLISSKRVEAVLRDPRVVAATLTGSGPAGRAVAAVAGDSLKPTVLELGGSDPFVVMPSADLPRAAQVGADARMLNNGQSCINAKRFIVHRDIADRFTDELVARMSGRRMGDPIDEATEVGPLATEQGRRDVDELVRDALDQGATALCGGTVPDGPGWFYPPTVLTGITPQMRVYREEVFGPVATVFTVDGMDEAIALANATEFGLGANAWTEEPDEQERFIAELDAGMVFVNGNTTSYPELPFGGIKGSGYGRELSAHGIRAFCNLTTVWVGDGGSAGDPDTE